VSPDTDATPSAVLERAATAVYVYGVSRHRAGDLGAEIVGVSGQPAPVRAVEDGALVALVSDVPWDWHAASRHDVAAHDRVLAELMRDRAIIPMRFGIVLPSDSAVRERLLVRHADTLAALAQRIEGREQMSVKAYYHDEAVLRAVLARRPELKVRADELGRLPVVESQSRRIALGQDVAAAVQEQRALDEQMLVESLSGLADEVRVDPSTSERHLTTIQLLVPQDRRPRLDAAVKRLGEEHAERLGLRYVGPLPPYSFCAFALTEEQEPWG
jgi:hypothetical protein